MNNCWVVGCAFNARRPRLVILARCLIPMNAQSWSVCVEKTPNYVWTVELLKKAAAFFVSEQKNR